MAIKERWDKFTEFCRKHDKDLKSIGMTIGMGVIGWCCGSVYTDRRIARGYAMFDRDGFLKWCNPATGEFVTAEKAIELIQEHYFKK